MAAFLLVLALVLPWNVHFGMGIPGTSGWVFALLVGVTLPALLALARTARGSLTESDDRAGSALLVPYMAMLAVFVGFAVVQSIRFGGDGTVPPGVGPGALFGMSGALLALHQKSARRDRACRVLGLVSITMASVAVVANLYWRLRYVVPQIGDEQTSVQNLVTAGTAVLYGAVALAPVILVGKWMISAKQPLTLVVLGVSTLLSGALVWLLPVGRDIDAFHGIAENTSTAGVGFEGYLAWVMAAAIALPSVALRRNVSLMSTEWRAPARACLGLIALWSGGSAVLRISDIASAAALDLPAPPYNGIAMMVFDLGVAIVAGLLMINAFGHIRPRAPALLGFAALFVLTVARLVIGVALVPRVKPLDAGDINPVYGNMLYQQITGTFDVVLCFLTLALVGVAANLFRLSVTEATVQRPAARDPEGATPAERAASVLAASTNRFAAGTVYGAAYPTPGDTSTD